MKKFSNIKEDVKQKYELKDTLRNEIYSLIEKSLSLKITDEDALDKDVNINGKEELVENIKKLIDDVRIKERTFALETVKANVYRNFDMRWLNEQIDGLKKIKLGTEFMLKEDIGGINENEQYKAEIINYFVKKLNDVKVIGNYDFEYDPSEGIFKFVNGDKGIVVKATPFYNDKNGVPIEVCDIDNQDSHYFIEQRAFDTENILYEEYFKMIMKFLIHDYEWMKKIDDYKDTDYRNITI